MSDLWPENAQVTVISVKKIEPIKWDSLNARLRGQPLETAVQDALQVVIAKLNEVIEELNNK